MRKTIDFSEEPIKIVVEYQKRNSLSNFTKAIKHIVMGVPSAKETVIKDDISDNNMEILGQAILEMNKKLDGLVKNTAPRYVD